MSDIAERLQEWIDAGVEDGIGATLAGDLGTARDEIERLRVLAGEQSEALRKRWNKINSLKSKQKRAADVIDAERALADDLAAELMLSRPKATVLARYREARQR